MSADLQKEKYERMTTAPVGRLVTSLAVPSIVSMLVSGVYNLADTFFIGQINTQSVAALGIVFSYMATSSRGHWGADGRSRLPEWPLSGFSRPS